LSKYQTNARKEKVNDSDVFIPQAYTHFLGPYGRHILYLSHIHIHIHFVAFFYFFFYVSNIFSYYFY